MKYYAVYTKLNQFPEAVFRSLAWAERFVKDQKEIWTNAKFKIYKIQEQEMGFKRFFNL